MWLQKQINLKSRTCGFYLVTDEIVQQLPELKKFKIGVAHIFMQHTSASLTLNENADPTVRQDFEDYFRVLLKIQSSPKCKAQKKFCSAAYVLYDSNKFFL